MIGAAGFLILPDGKPAEPAKKGVNANDDIQHQDPNPRTWLHLNHRSTHPLSPI